MTNREPFQAQRVRLALKDLDKIVCVDICVDGGESEQIQDVESGAGLGVDRRRGEPAIAKELSDVVRRVHQMASTVSILDRVYPTVKHDHRADSLFRVQTRTAAVPELIYEAQRLQADLLPVCARLALTNSEQHTSRDQHEAYLDGMKRHASVPRQTAV